MHRSPSVQHVRHAFIQTIPRSRYVGAAFVVADDVDLARIRLQSGGVTLSADLIPNGGRVLALKDPDGNAVWLIQDWGKWIRCP
jgi:catechol 2,3-dioxygenase-like lactoylglutathione lyase family enzyme